jgi:hypothetical protein
LEWEPKAQKAFEDLKTTFITVPILVHPDFSKPFYMKTDASNFALRTVLSQERKRKRLHPIALHSRKFSTIQINYEIPGEIHNKDFLAIVDSFQKWRHLLKGASH